MALKYARDLKAIPLPSSLGELCSCGLSLEFVVAVCNGTGNKETEQNPCGSIHMQDFSTWKKPCRFLVLSPCTCVTELARSLFCPLPFQLLFPQSCCSARVALLFPTLQGNIQFIRSDVNKNTSTLSSSLTKS